MKVGIIAEDFTDIEVIKILLDKLCTKKVGTSHFIGHGCGAILGKCRKWAENLRDRGCTVLLVVHDLDERHQQQLYRQIATALHPVPIVKHCVVIPVKELEAWLLADTRAIKNAFNIREAITPIANPEALNDPKKKLRDLIEKQTRQRVSYSTALNKKIAEHCSVQALNKCSSFRVLSGFFSPPKKKKKTKR